MTTATRPRTAAATEARKAQALTRKIRAAAALLRLHGWTVLAPGTGDDR